MSRQKEPSLPAGCLATQNGDAFTVTISEYGDNDAIFDRKYRQVERYVRRQWGDFQVADQRVPRPGVTRFTLSRRETPITPLSANFLQTI